VQVTATTGVGKVHTRATLHQSIGVGETYWLAARRTIETHFDI